MDIQNYMTDIGRAARKASRAMAKADTAAKNRALQLIAAAIRRDAALLSAANQKDLDAARANGLAPALVDRLTLSDKAVATMAEGLEQIAALPDPIGEINNMKRRPSGIQVGQMRVPLGVIGIIYEARPNVTVDAAGLCIKSGNATILRGGSEALHCNQALAKLVKEGLAGAGLQVGTDLCEGRRLAVLCEVPLQGACNQLQSLDLSSTADATGGGTHVHGGADDTVKQLRLEGLAVGAGIKVGAEL